MLTSKDVYKYTSLDVYKYTSLDVYKYTSLLLVIKNDILACMLENTYIYINDLLSTVK
jgi:hypothetical protein